LPNSGHSIFFVQIPFKFINNHPPSLFVTDQNLNKKRRFVAKPLEFFLSNLLCFAGGPGHRGNCTTPGGPSSTYSSQHFARQISAKLPESYSLSEHV